MASLALAFDILARDKGASKEFNKVGKAAEDAGKSASGFGSLMKGAVSLASGALAAAGISSYISDSISAARESNAIAAITAQTIKSTGGAAKITADQVGELAGAISEKTGKDDEMIQSGANMLLTFTKVRNEVGKGNDIFNQATQAALDLSAHGFGSMDSASVMLGKALNDPVKGMTTLTRAGIQFTGDQKAIIKALVEGGDKAAAMAMGITNYSDVLKRHKGDSNAAYREITAGMSAAQKKQFDYYSEGGHEIDAQKLLLKELNTQVGGTAAATSTASEKMSVAWGNLQEDIGNQLIPVVDGLATAMTNNVIPAIRGLIDATKTVVQWMGDHKEIVGGVTLAMGALFAITKLHSAYLAVEAVGSLGKYIAQTGLVTSLTRTWTAVQWLMNAALSANPIGIVIALIAGLAAGLVIAYQKSDTFREIVNKAFDAVCTAAKFMWNNVLRPTFKFILDLWLTIAGGIVKGAAKAFGWIPGLGPKLDEASTAIDNFKKDVNKALDGIQDEGVNVKVNFTGKASAPSSGSSRANFLFSGGAVGKYATGGAVRGPGTGTSDSILALLSNGEHVLTAKEVAALGGHGAVTEWRKSLAAYAKGGPVLDVDVYRPNSAAIKNTILRGTAQQTAANADAIIKAITAATTADGAVPVGSGGKVYGWQQQWAWVKSHFPSARLTSSYRPGSITVSGNRSYHASGRAIDVSPSMAIFNGILNAFGKSIKELIYSPAGGAQIKNGARHFYTGAVRAMHYNHVHWAMANGGLVPGSGLGDKVPAMLEPGEYVVRRQAAQRAGTSALDALNNNGGTLALDSGPLRITGTLDLGDGLSGYIDGHLERAALTASRRR